MHFMTPLTPTCDVPLFNPHISFTQAKQGCSLSVVRDLLPLKTPLLISLTCARCTCALLHKPTPQWFHSNTDCADSRCWWRGLGPPLWTSLLPETWQKKPNASRWSRWAEFFLESVEKQRLSYSCSLQTHQCILNKYAYQYNWLKVWTRHPVTCQH